MPPPSRAADTPLRLGLPKGRTNASLVDLLAAVGLPLAASARAYRPRLPWPRCDVKLLKHRNVVEMLRDGARDVGFAGADWVAETRADLIEVLDTELDPVRVVAAAPSDLASVLAGIAPRPLRVASEYVALTRRWVTERGLDAVVVRSYGSTEAFPPEDADVIVDNTATGATLAANGLRIVDELLRSTTRLYASRAAWTDPARRARIEDLALLLRSVLEARRRVLLEMNVAARDLDRVVEVLPAMREATVAELYGNQGFSVRAAVPRSELPVLLPALSAAGASDILVARPDQIVAGRVAPSTTRRVEVLS